jgi:hypothetical protein
VHCLAILFALPTQLQLLGGSAAGAAGDAASSVALGGAGEAFPLMPLQGWAAATAGGGIGDQGSAPGSALNGLLRLLERQLAGL